jgi:hypothetical protein
MDFTVIPIEKVKAAFARALALNSDREAAAHAAAQALGITFEAVREVVGADAAAMGFPLGPVTIYHGSPPCAGFAHPLSGRTEIEA